MGLGWDAEGDERGGGDDIIGIAVFTLSLSGSSMHHVEMELGWVVEQRATVRLGRCQVPRAIVMRDETV